MQGHQSDQALPLTVILTTALAIFAMLFGSGNLMFPPKVGLLAGNHIVVGFLSFVLGAVVLPLLGLLAIIAFDGDYRRFFSRLGHKVGFLFVVYSMLAIGPLIIMPRIVGLSYRMAQPLLPTLSSGLFAFFFLAAVFIATYRPERLLALLGKVLSPAKLMSVLAIIIFGIVRVGQPALSTLTARQVMHESLMLGYGTLDLLGSIFFGAVIVHLLRGKMRNLPQARTQLMRIASFGALGAACLLALVYAGMTYLGYMHGYGFEAFDPGQLLCAISQRLFGVYGAAAFGLTVLIACFTTTVSLTMVVSDFLRRDILRMRVSHMQAVMAVLSVCLIAAQCDLSVIMKMTLPLIAWTYPLFIVITVCNLLHKLFGLQMIKLPVALTAVAMALQPIVALLKAKGIV
jgi:LIVCS family branched-chain amino acid:cation transporter